MTGPRSRWVSSGSETLEMVMAQLNDPDALAQGRVFLDGVRAKLADTALSPGMVVEVYAAREVPPSPRVLAVEEGLVFVDKPVGLATEPERRGSSTCLVHLVAKELGHPIERVHALSRLDVAVSGVVLLGVERRALQRVQEQRSQGLVRRRYVAIARGVPVPAQGAWTESIGKKGRGPGRVADARGEPARTDYRVAAAVEAHPASVLSLDPRTGRTHQLRVHAATHGAPFFGDRTYGGPTRFMTPDGGVVALERVFLHAAWIQLAGGARVYAPLPEAFETLWSSLGGDGAAFTHALDAASNRDDRSASTEVARPSDPG